MEKEAKERKVLRVLIAVLILVVASSIVIHMFFKFFPFLLELGNQVIVEIKPDVTNHSAVATKTAEDIIDRLIEMQGATLSILSLLIAVASIGIGATSILHWRQVVALKKEYSELEEKMCNYFAVAIVQSIIPSQRIYIKADMLLANDFLHIFEGNSRDKGLHYLACLELIFSKEKDAELSSKMDEMGDEECFKNWEDVSLYSDEVIKSHYANKSIRYIARLKYINANYQMCRLIRQTSRLDAYKYIKNAQRELNNINENELDPYGYIDNLRGLVLFWRCKCEEDQRNEKYNDISKCAATYQRAYDCFAIADRKAIMMTPGVDNSKFRNHMGASKINQGRCLAPKNLAEAKECLKEARKIYEDIEKAHKNYGLGYLNLSHTLCLSILLNLGIIKSDYFLEDIVESFYNASEELKTTILDDLKEAEHLLKAASENGVEIPDVDFRMFEIISWRIVLRKNENIPRLEKEMCNKLRKYHLIAISDSSTLFDKPQESQKVILGFIAPWRNYVFWKGILSGNPVERQLCFDTAYSLNEILLNEKRTSAENWLAESQKRREIIRLRRTFQRF